MMIIRKWQSQSLTSYPLFVPNCLTFCVPSQHLLFALSTPAPGLTCLAGRSHQRHWYLVSFKNQAPHNLTSVCPVAQSLFNSYPLGKWHFSSQWLLGTHSHPPLSSRPLLLSCPLSCWKDGDHPMWAHSLWLKIPLLCCLSFFSLFSVPSGVALPCVRPALIQPFPTSTGTWPHLLFFWFCIFKIFLHTGALPFAWKYSLVSLITSPPDPSLNLLSDPLLQDAAFFPYIHWGF